MRWRDYLTGPRLVTMLLALSLAILIWLLTFAYLTTSNRNRQMATEARQEARENQELVGRVEDLTLDIRAIERFNRRNLIHHRRDNRRTHALLLRRIAAQHARLLQAIGVNERRARQIFQTSPPRLSPLTIQRQRSQPTSTSGTSRRTERPARTEAAPARCNKPTTKASSKAGGSKCP